jgi:hypothetical protein
MYKSCGIHCLFDLIFDIAIGAVNEISGRKNFSEKFEGSF